MNFEIFSFLSILTVPGIAFLLGFLAPLIGIILVMRRFSLLADTLSHVSLFGVALSSLFGLPMVYGAFVSAILGGGGIELLRQSRRVLSEATLAIFLSGSLSLAVILFALRGVEAEEIESYLFGDLALVTPQDFLLILGITLILLPFFFAFYQKLFLATLDEDLARVNGVAVNRLNFLFMLLASLVVAAAIKIVGVLLVSALIVLPVMAALQWRRGFTRTLFVSLLFSETAVGLGLTFSNIFQIPSGAAIALVTLSLFILSYIANFRFK